MQADPARPFPYRRVVVIGVTGSGKSHLAEQLAEQLDVDFIELDALYWKPNWGETELDEFRRKVDKATGAPGWVLAGNYNQVRDITWPRAQAVIWLDYPFLLVFGRLCRRTWQRWRSQEVMWGTNTEKMWPQFKLWSKESLFYWQVRSYRRHKWLYPQLFASPEYAHLQVFHFKHPDETEEWLEALS